MVHNNLSNYLTKSKSCDKLTDLCKHNVIYIHGVWVPIINTHTKIGTPHKKAPVTTQTKQIADSAF